MYAYTDIGFIIASWGVTLGGLGAYAAWVIRRGRTLADRVPEEDRRWT